MLGKLVFGHALNLFWARKLNVMSYQIRH